ncbi:MDR family MFS transporter [Actinomadura rudentiformis]|uniref:MFS transporter n=1 Tax=Actinomadura rudentiformis TaxID=359158 RepID=A0A6H9YAG7_9ACTN|nr:MDR family MFS transporter [Actinomadura rudentiformis]KAB2342171.1 MFS transporter [Actinomadura rudentiformis]
MAGTPTATEPPPATEPPVSKARNQYVVLGAVLIAMMLASLDNLILGTAMPTIVGDLGGMAHLSWVVTAYTLATAVSTPVWGKLGDMYGRKGVFLTSIVIFLIGSMLAGVSQDMTQLIAFRAVQGLGGGGLMVGAFALIASLFPPNEQGKYQGMISGVMGLTMIGGPLIGGFITDNLSWRWCFYVNLPLGALALVMVTTVLHLPKQPLSDQRREARIDYLGVALLGTAIASLVLAATWGGNEYAWDSATIIGLGVLAVVSGAAFLFAERRAAEPVLPLGLFRNRNFTLVTLVGFLLGVMMFGAMTFLPLFQQAVQGASATNAGILMMPVFLSMVLINAFAGPFITRTGRYKPIIIVGSVLVTVGVLLLAQMDTGTSRPMSMVFMAFLGAGMGCLMQTTMIVTMQSVELKDIGVASSTATLSRTIGGSIGVAVAGALFTGRVQDVMAGHGYAGSSENAQLDSAALAKLPDAMRDVYEQAVAAGTHQVFLMATALGVLAFAATWFIKQVPLKGPAERAAELRPADREPAPELV